MHREVYEIPVIRLLCIFQIHRQNFVTSPNSFLVIYKPFGRQPFKLVHKYQQTTKSYLMPFRHQQFRHLFQWKVVAHSLNDFSCLWHLQSQELIAIAILTGSRLKEPHEYLPLLLIPQRLHIRDYLLSFSHFTIHFSLKPPVPKGISPYPHARWP